MRAHLDPGKVYEDIFRQLNRNKVDYVVVGGVALVLHGIVRLTADLDLMLSLDGKNLHKFISLMTALGFRPRVPVKAESLADPSMRLYWHEEKQMEVFSFYHPKQAIGLVDVFIKEPIPFDEVNAEAVRIRAGSLSIPVASLDHLMVMKKISARKQDKEDIEAIKRLKRNEKD
jgi:diphthamide synthase (EF-2-diphthine--ammonia ligase)